MAEDRGRATGMIRRRRLLILLLLLLLRCEKLLHRGELLQLELLLRGELLQIDGWQHERHGVVCAAGVDAGGRAVGRRLDISHDANKRSKAVYRQPAATSEGCRGATCRASMAQ